MDNEVNDFIFPAPDFNSNLKLNSFLKKNLIYIPTQRKIKNKENEEITEKIPCLFIKNLNSPNILIIFHCNGCDMFDTYSYISYLFKKYNINILLAEYPGYSLYNNCPCSSQICLENSLIIYDFILSTNPKLTEKNIYVLGRSLGTGPATYLSSQRKPAATFLISPYTTFADVGNHDQEFYEKLSKHFRSIDYIDKVTSPLLIIHGKKDKLIDYNKAIKLYEKTQKNMIKDLKLFENMEHNFNLECLEKNIIPAIIEFAEKNCPTYKLENIIVKFDKKFYDLSDNSKNDDSFELKNIDSDNSSDEY